MKTKLTLKLLILGLLTFACCLAVHAQGTAFTYQGQLQNNGSPANGSYDLQFTLFDAAVSGNQVGGSVTNLAVGVTNGLFTVVLDFGPGIFTGPPLWLQIGVETNGGGGYTTLAPLQQLTPTPYAIYSPTAGSAASANGVAAGSVTGAGIAGNSVVKSLNNLQDAVTLSPGANVTITPSGNTLTIASAGGSGVGGWSLTGNSGTTPGANYLGTSDNQPLEVHVNGLRALRLEPDNYGEGAPNVIGGSPVNFVASGVDGATIGGGGSTNIYGFGFAVSNSVTGSYGTVSGGYQNTVTGPVSTVGGGEDNQAGGALATVGGGYGNITTNNEATVGGGEGNIGGGQYAFVGGGIFNQAIGPGAFVGGGGYNGSSAMGNTASGVNSVVAGGSGNIAINTNATVGGGYDNTNSGAYATIPGGLNNIAKGQASFAAGQLATANDNNSFVWGDGTRAAVSQGANTFAVLATGGVYFYTTPGGVVAVDSNGDLDFGATTRQMLNLYNSSYGIGVQTGDEYFRSAGQFYWYQGGSHTNANGNAGGGTQLMELDNNGNLHASGTVYANGVALTSDRNAKENFASVDSQAVLAKVASLPVTEWNYKTDSKGVQHIGPMAQDFQAAFGMNGGDDKHISVVDEGGVALAAIQGLNQKVESENSALRAENAELKQRLETLEKIVLNQKSN